MMIKLTNPNKFFFFFLLFVFGIVCPALADSDKTCPTFQDFLSDGWGSNCLICGVYQIVADACANVVNLSWKTFAKPLQGVVAVAASLYVAVYTLKNLASFSQQDPLAFLSNDKTGIVPLLVKAAAVCWLLGNESFLYSHLIGPVISAGATVGQEFNTTFSMGTFSTPNNVQSLFSVVIGQLQDFNNVSYSTIAYARLMFCLTFLPDGLIENHWELLPFALVLYVFGWFILISVAFYLLDVLFRLAVGCMLLPMAVACGFSKFTSDYTKKTWDLFINVFFNFVMLGIVLQFTLLMLEKSMTRNTDSFSLLNSKNIFSDSDIDEFVQNIDLIAFILTVVCSMISFKLFMEVENLADKLSGTSSIGKLGQQAGAVAVGTVKNVAAWGVKQNLNVANAARKEVGGDINRFVKTSKPYKALMKSKAGRAYRKLRYMFR